MRKFGVFAASIFAILVSTTVKADDAAMQKYRNWLPSQVRAMPDKLRDAEMPMTYIMAANTALSPLGDLALQSNLNTLMYNGVADFDGAKRRFQSDLGEQPTGNLTVSQIAKLGYRAERTQLTNVNFFSYGFNSQQFEHSAFVHGTVKLVGENIAYPVNYTEIECDKEAGTCSYRQLALVLPDESSWAQSYNVMETTNETYKITRWEGSRIEARPETEGTCRVNELRLNFANKEFYEFTTNAPEGKCEMPLGGSFPKLERPRIAQIVDGQPIITAKFEQIRQDTYKFLSSEFRARVDAATSPATK